MITLEPELPFLPDGDEIMASEVDENSMNGGDHLINGVQNGEVVNGEVDGKQVNPETGEELQDEKPEEKQADVQKISSPPSTV